MSSLLPREEFPPGLEKGQFVPLTVAEFSEAYAAFGAVAAGELPPDPDFPSMYQDCHTGKATPLEDTPFNRAWCAAGKLFEDPARRVELLQRQQRDADRAREESTYVNEEVGSMHIALMATMAALPFSQRTTAKALRASFDAEFRRRLASTIEAGPRAPALIGTWRAARRSIHAAWCESAKSPPKDDGCTPAPTIHGAGFFLPVVPFRHLALGLQPLLRSATAPM